jgi:CrcB protein
MWSSFLLVAAGGAIGAVARYGIGLGVARVLFPASFPWATLMVNVSGSLLFGFLAFYLSERLPLAADLRAFLLVGVLGGFTTFSTFSWETLALLETGAFVKAGLNILASVVLCLAAAMLGMLLARQIV